MNFEEEQVEYEFSGKPITLNDDEMRWSKLSRS